MFQIKKMLSSYISNKDNKNLLFNVIGNYLVKGGAMLVSLIVMPAYMQYFESQAVLGMWFTLIQLLNWIMFLDFGIGGGIRNKIIEPLKRCDKSRVTELVSVAYISVAAIVLSLIVLQYFIVGQCEKSVSGGIAFDGYESKNIPGTGGELGLFGKVFCGGDVSV